jgi:ORF6N domain
MSNLETIKSKIHEIRGQKVMLDYDLAMLYETETKVLKQAVRRNMERFPEDFMFELTEEEFENLRSQIVTSNRGGLRYSPFAFIEQGIAMLSSVLKSQRAIDINIAIMRTFVKIRQFSLSYEELRKRIDEIENQFPDIYKALNYLVDKDSQEIKNTERKKIGYKK